MELQIEEHHGGQRIVGRAAYRGHPVDVVTGYDARSDRWPMHLYVDGKKVDGFSGFADTRDEALAAGAREAKRLIDSAKGGGFQRQVHS